MENSPENTLSDIRRLMDRSSRFHALSGFSLVAAGICGILGIAWVKRILLPARENYSLSGGENLRDQLMVAALCILAAAILSGFFFTWLRARKKGLHLWNVVFRRVTISFLIPMVAGGALVIGMIFYREYHFIAACCLLFYGLALVNAAHHTLVEIRILGILEVLTGIFCLFSGYQVLSLAIGFGVWNIVYGVVIGYKYKEKVSVEP